MKVLPLHFHSGRPELADGLQREFDIRLIFVIVTNRGHCHGIAAVTFRMLHRQHAKGAARTGFQKNRIFELPNFAQSVSKSRGASCVHGPISGIGCLAGCDPGSGNVRDITNRGFVQSDFLHLFFECFGDGLEHTRVKGVGILNVAANDILLLKRGLEVAHGRYGTGDDAEARTVDERDGKIFREQRDQFFF